MGNPKGNWFPWLSAELQQLGVEVSVPCFPTPEGQNLSNWLNTLQVAVGKIQSKHILVGHSIGAAFVLRILERLEAPVKAVYLVAGFAQRLGLPDYDSYNQTFVEGDFDWARIRKNAELIKIYSGDNDPYVPLKFGEEIAQKLEQDLCVIKGGGHLNSEFGFDKFELLLNDIRKSLSLGK